jgi:hypothetical protein
MVHVLLPFMVLPLYSVMRLSSVMCAPRLHWCASVYRVQARFACRRRCRGSAPAADGVHPVPGYYIIALLAAPTTR